MKKNKKGLIYIIIGLILILCSIILLFYNLYSNHKANSEGINVSEKVETIITTTNSELIDDYPDYYYNPNMSMPTEVVDGKKYVGMLYIDSINLKLPVQDSWSYSNKLPSKYFGTAYLNNMIICAHNYKSHFGKLKKLKIGDIIIFEDMTGNIFKYQVSEVLMIKGTDVEQMKNSEWDLTLFTCDSNNTRRITIRCEKIKNI